VIKIQTTKTNRDVYICLITLKQAQIFVREHHRHNDPPHGHKFSIDLMKNEGDSGVVTVGQPIARANCDGYTAEITRCCVLDGQQNANSKLYAAALRTAKAMGYRRVVTYSLPEESGASLKAVGFEFDGFTKSTLNGWDSPSRPRRKPLKYPYCKKMRWFKQLQT
jgi:hypothetical protein